MAPSGSKKNKELEETKERLRLVTELVSDVLVSKENTIPYSLYKNLLHVKRLADFENTKLSELQQPTEVSSSKEIVISCSSTITKNPGGEVAVGFVIRFPKEDKLKLVKMAKRTVSSNRDEAKYDAIYESLVYLFNHYNRPSHEIVVQSDSQSVVKELLGESKPTVERKRDSIHELVSDGPAPVRIEWAARNTTSDLISANFLAQDLLHIRLVK